MADYVYAGWTLMVNGKIMYLKCVSEIRKKSNVIIIKYYLQGRFLFINFKQSGLIFQKLSNVQTRFNVRNFCIKF